MLSKAARACQHRPKLGLWQDSYERVCPCGQYYQRQRALATAVQAATTTQQSNHFHFFTVLEVTQWHFTHSTTATPATAALPVAATGFGAAVATTSERQPEPS